MPFLSSRELPSPEEYGTMLQQSHPHAAVTSARTLHGAGMELRLPTAVGPLVMRLNHVQGRKRPVARTTVRVEVPTRGLLVALSPARSMPSSAARLPLTHPGLAEQALLAAPASAASHLLDTDVQKRLTLTKGVDDSPANLDVQGGQVSLTWSGWPGDAATAQAIVAITADIAARVPSIVDALAGQGGTLEGHPEVQQMLAWRAARQRFGRGLLIALALGTLLVMLLIVGISLLWLLLR